VSSQRWKTGNRTKLDGNPLLSVLTILTHRGEMSSLMQRIKQESSLTGGGSLAYLLHHLSRIQHRSEEQKADTWHLSEREEQGFGVGSTNRKWNLGMTSGFFTLRKE
jgi:hypothetical protein